MEIPRRLILPREALVAGLLMIALILVLLLPLPPLALIITVMLTAMSIIAMQFFSDPVKPVETRKVFFTCLS